MNQCRCLRFLIGLGLAGLFWVETPSAAEPSREAEVAQRGTEVMPFSLEKTLHQFTKTPKGGVQKVLARDPNDIEQIQLIRLHLKTISEQFSRGDFSGPTHIHGDAMPGLAQLKQAKPGSLRIRYELESDGAKLVYEAKRADLIAAIHRWFDAQVHDHGHDAMMLHHQHHAVP